MNQLALNGNDLIHALKGENGEDIVTEIRLTDGFVNATKLCKSAGKFWADYFKNKSTQLFLTELIGNMKKSDGNMKKINGNMNISFENIIDSEVGGNHDGTWVHPDVAIDLARWCSTKFHVAITQLVRKFLCGELTTKDSKEASKAFHNRILITDYNKKNVIYVGLVDTDEFKGAKVGYTDDIVRREREHKNDIGSFRLIKVYEAINNRQLERVILTECSSLDVRTSAYINGKNQTELIQFKTDFTVDNLIDLIETLIDKTKTQMIEDIRNDVVLECQQEKTRQMELQLEMERFRKAEYEKIEMAKQSIEENKVAYQKIIQEQEDTIQKIKEEYEKKMKEYEEELEKERKKDQQEDIDPYKELDNYFAKYCEFGEDTVKDRYRITCEELYEHYCKYIRVPTKDADFKEYTKKKYNVSYKAANWHHEIKQTWFGIRLKDFVTKKRSTVQKLIFDFINIKCELGEEYMEDTKVLYDKFEEYAKDKGLETVKQNGFTRQLFKKEMLAMFNMVKVKEYAIDGKKHAFTGIRFLGENIQFPDALKEFTRDHCVFGPGYRVKSTDLYNEFQKYYSDKVDISRIKFYKAFVKAHPDLQKKHVTKSDLGYVGVILRKDYVKSE
jgi:hypothetical protein